MGYIRSSVRLFWHSMELMRDNSPWAFTHTIGFAANVMSMNVLIFWVFLLFVFWLGEFASHKVPEFKESGAEEPMKAGARPVIAGGSK